MRLAAQFQLEHERIGDAGSAHLERARAALEHQRLERSIQLLQALGVERPLGRRPRCDLPLQSTGVTAGLSVTRTLGAPHSAQQPFSLVPARMPARLAFAER